MDGRVIAAAAALALGACGAAEEAAGPRIPGLRVRLVLLDPAPALGKPLRVRVDLVNDGPSAVLYDCQQAAVNESLEVRGPDGRPLAYLAGSFQTAGTLEELGARTSRPIVDEIDVAAQYLITRPGLLTMRLVRGISAIESAKIPALRSGVPYDSEKHDVDLVDVWGSHVRIPCEPLAVEVGPGRAREPILAAERLLPVLPPGWQLSVQPPGEGDEVDLALVRPGGDKTKTLVLSVRLSAGPPEGSEEKAGSVGVRSLYLTGSPRGDEAWPGWKNRVKEALGAK